MDATSTTSVGVIMNGVTGRMGSNQHLMRSIMAIREDGGVPLGNGGVVMPEPVLVGRNASKLKTLSEETGIDAWTTDLDTALADDDNEIYFDALLTELRPPRVRKAIDAGKHIYSEKPSALTTETAIDLYERAEEAGVKHGVVQDKLWLPGLQKLQELIDSGFFGEILSVRGEFGYWVFTGETMEAQRPSWNYRKEDGGGIILDMFCHWRYVLDNLFSDVESLSCTSRTHIDRRWDEEGEPYEATAEDAAYALFELEDGVVAQFNSSWCVRVRRDDLLTIQVDGTQGSAVAGLRECWVQPLEATPKPVWNPDIPQPVDFDEGWTRVPTRREYKNAFRNEWELFLRHVVEDAPFKYDLLEGAKGVQLAELGEAAAEQQSWVEVPSLEASTVPAAS
jgi:predicted dehydrogenase